MPLQRTEAIVIGSLDLGEADRLITFYSRQFGKMKAVASGSRRLKSRWSRSTQLLTHCTVVFYEKRNTQLNRLRQCDIINSFSGLWSELKKITAGLYLAELIVRTTLEGEENEELYHLILQILSLIEQGGDIETSLRIFEIRALRMLGYEPQITRCVRCDQIIGKAQRVIFSPAEGGVVCSNCLGRCRSNEVSVSSGSLHFLQRALRLNVGKIGRLGLAKTMKPELKDMLHSYLTYHLDRDINSFRFLEL
jgi:DNA repair protein RecO (recombination protein O)